MKTFITSDLHFYHKSIIDFCPKTRGHFTDFEHMNREMIREWNESVSDDDVIYILGDISFGTAAKTVAVLTQLKGTKILIEGNHDSSLMRDRSFRECFKYIRQYEEIKYNGSFIVMSHYPFIEWNRMHHGSIHFHGHVHGNITGNEAFRCRDVGFDATGKVVSLLDDLVEDAMKGAIKSHHNKIKSSGE